MTTSPSLFHLRRSTEPGSDFVVACPHTGRPVPQSQLDELERLSVQAPLALSQDRAMAVMVDLNRTQAPPLWQMQLAPAPCPRCGQEPEADDPDFCYPEDRTYSSYNVGCWVHNLGCGFECSGATRDDAIAQWNHVALFDYPSEHFVRPERLGKEGLRVLLLDELRLRGQGSKPAVQALGDLVEELCSDTAHRLHYVARVFRGLLIRWPDRNETR